MYLDAVKSSVCALCEQSDDEGCSISGHSLCMIEKHLPRIVQVSAMVQSDKVEDYVAAFRQHICTNCRQDGNAFCFVRESEACGLDQYFPLVVEAIEAVNKRYEI